MAPRKGKAQTNSSLAISVVVHVAAIGGIFYFAHKTGMLPQQIYKITGIKAPEEKKEKPKPKPPEDLPPKPSEIQETVETPPDAAARPPADVPLTARTGNSDAPAARGNGGIAAQARPQGADTNRARALGCYGSGPHRLRHGGAEPPRRRAGQGVRD